MGANNEKPEDTTAVRVVGVRAEHRADGLGLGTPEPRLSWRTETTRPAWVQASYEARALDDDGATVAESGVVDSSDSVLVPWPGAALTSRQRCSVQVRVTGADGVSSDWSDPAVIETGLLDVRDWSAGFVGPAWDEDTSSPQPVPYLRREFVVEHDVERARLYATALGVYEIELNGARVGDHVLAPGWSSYSHRLRYETFDVTPMVRTGANAIGAIVGDGWYRGSLVDVRRRNRYGDRLAFLCQLELTFVDGSETVITTDEHWRVATGPILATGLYEGETHDARLELAGWSEPGFDDATWSPVLPVEHDLETLVTRDGPPVRAIERVQPVEILTSPSGRCIVDFGQNLVGRVELSVSGSAGETVTLRHAEVLQDGELCTEPLRSAEATDRYTLVGDGEEVWQPRFTFHGFRYVDVEGWPGEVAAEHLTAVVLHSDMERTGWFECSDERVNHLHENIVWGMRGNFLDLPTDCPQRDERLGWTGDINVFAPTASFLYDCAGFLTSWLRELAAEQTPEGVVPWVIPNVLEWLFPTAVWGDAAVVVPATVHARFGDEGVLRAQYPSMRAWVEHVAALAGERHLWTGSFQFADWLDPTARDANPLDQRTDPDLLATAAFCHSLDLVADAAARLGKKGDARRYRALAARVRSAFAREFVTPSGRLASDAQTAYSLAIVYDLLPKTGQVDGAGRRLRRLVKNAGYTIATGFVGTPIICDALTETGHVDAAYALLLQEKCPSWLYPVLRGATTIWERWDAITPDGRVNSAGIGMLSFNHYAFGAVGDWLHRTVGGLAPDAPGYRRLRIAPQPGGALTSATARHDTPYGLAESSWHLDGGHIHLQVVVPPNSVGDRRGPRRGHRRGRLGNLRVARRVRAAGAAATRARLARRRSRGRPAQALPASALRVDSSDWYRPSAIPWTSALPSAVASVGPVDTSSPEWRCRAATSSDARAPPPKSRTPPTRGPSGGRGSAASTVAAVAAIDSTAQRTTAARSVWSSRPAACRSSRSMSCGARKRGSVASTSGTSAGALAASSRSDSRLTSPHTRRHSSTSHQPATFRRSLIPPVAPCSFARPATRAAAEVSGSGCSRPTRSQVPLATKTWSTAPPAATADAVS